MDTNKILSAHLLDLVFDNRNKDYGAYELRKNYQTRITKALVFTGIFVLLTFTGVVLANKLKPKEKSSFVIRELTLEAIKPDEKKPEPIPETPRQTIPPQIQTERFTPPQIVNDDQVDQPPPTQEELTDSRIGLEDKEGVIDDGIEDVQHLDEQKDIIEEQIIKDEGP